MKTAAEYANSAERYSDLALGDESYASRAQVFATLALAAATLEAAGPPWPEAAKAMEDQYAPYYCSREWVDEEAAIPSAEPGHTDGKPHRCAMAHPHPDDPHYCHCGSEL
jgi:hypothetical protein